MSSLKADGSVRWKHQPNVAFKFHNHHLGSGESKAAAEEVSALRQAISLILQWDSFQ